VVVLARCKAPVRKTPPGFDRALASPETRRRDPAGARHAKRDPGMADVLLEAWRGDDMSQVSTKIREAIANDEGFAIGLGAVAGAAMGALAGPLGVLAGASLGATAGMIAGAAHRVREELRKQQQDAPRAKAGRPAPPI
jgi:hypothetical protein